MKIQKIELDHPFLRTETFESMYDAACRIAVSSFHQIRITLENETVICIPNLIQKRIEIVEKSK